MNNANIALRKKIKNLSLRRQEHSEIAKIMEGWATIYSKTCDLLYILHIENIIKVGIVWGNLQIVTVGPNPGIQKSDQRGAFLHFCSHVVGPQLLHACENTLWTQRSTQYQRIVDVLNACDQLVNTHAFGVPADLLLEFSGRMQI